MEKRAKYAKLHPEMSNLDLTKILSKKYKELPEKKKVGGGGRGREAGRGREQLVHCGSAMTGRLRQRASTLGGVGHRAERRASGSHTRPLPYSQAQALALWKA